MCTVLIDFWQAMAKKRSDKKSGQRERIIPVTSEAVVPVYLPSLPKSSLTDLRFYQPNKPKVTYDDLGRRSKIVQAPVRPKASRSSVKNRPSKYLARLQEAFRERLSFAEAGRALVCVRRKQRREVIFAKRYAGRGASRRSRRRSAFSNVRC